MSTIEDFENAPIGATATHPSGRNTYRREKKTLVGADWVRGEGEARLWADADSLASFGYILGPAPSPAPTTAQEALDLAWELAHEVKEGQTIPRGARHIIRSETRFHTRALNGPHEVSPWDEVNVRTLDPIPDPEPDWLNAPAVTAREALALAWDLAHEMKEGHELPIGTECIAKVADGEFVTYRSLKPFDGARRPGWAEARTLDPLPEPEPDWLNAPAILATCGCRGVELWHPHSTKGGMWVSVSGENALWSTLRDVTPLYPKGQDQ